jgi:hypothetical protein
MERARRATRGTPVTRAEYVAMITPAGKPARAGKRRLSIDATDQRGIAKRPTWFRGGLGAPIAVSSLCAALETGYAAVYGVAHPR